ncbi:MAG: hypothetical protein SGJ02_01180, partial [bacterium]|nr:hypothetical protein [bacterium]
MTNFSELSTRVKTATLLITALVALYVIAIITDYARWLFLFTMFAVVCVTSFEFATVCTSERGLKHKAPLYFIVCLIPALLVLVSFLTVEVSASSDDYYAAYRHVALLAASAGIFISFIITITYGLFLGRDDREVFAIVNREAPLGIFHVGFCGAILM